MTETIRGAWIGAGAAIFIGLAAILFAPIATEKLSAPKEGVFAADQSCITGTNIDTALRAQVVSFPCRLRISHIEGPAVTKLSVRIDSKKPLSSLKVGRNDENINPTLATDGLSLSVEVPTLRQRSAIELQFDSNGEPDTRLTVVDESGHLANGTDAPQELPIWKHPNIYLAGAIGIFYLLAMIGVLKVLRPATLGLTRTQVAFAATLTIANFLPYVGSTINTLLLVMIFFAVTNKIP